MAEEEETDDVAVVTAPLGLNAANLVGARAPARVAAASPPSWSPSSPVWPANFPVNLPIPLPLPLSPTEVVALALALAAEVRGAHLVRARAAPSDKRTSRAVGNQRRSAENHATPVVKVAVPPPPPRSECVAANAVPEEPDKSEAE